MLKVAPGAQRKSRSFLVVVFLVAATAWMSDASAETYVILSLMGDHLTLVGLASQTGSHLDQKPHQTVAASGFDDFAVRVADAAIAKARPAAEVVALRASDPELYKMRDSWLDTEAADVRQVISLLPASIPRSADAWLVLMVPYRDELELKTREHRLGAGKVSGLGLYVDAQTWMRRADTLETAQGFLGVFAHFQLMLINLQSGNADGHQRVVLGTTYPAALAKDRSPWNALTETQKARALQALIKQGIEESLTPLLGSKKP